MRRGHHAEHGRAALWAVGYDDKTLFGDTTMRPSRHERPKKAATNRRTPKERECDEAVAGIREGLADLEQGRVRAIEEVDAALRSKYRIPRDD